MGTLEDMEVGSGVKHEQGKGISKDNGETFATESKGDLADERKSDDGVDCDLVTESEAEVQAEPANQLSDGNHDNSSSNGNESVLKLPDEVEEWMKDGNALYKMGNHAEALKKYSKCVEHLWEGNKLVGPKTMEYIRLSAINYG